MTFSIYAVPALLALITKAGVFIYDRLSKVRNLQTRLFLAFLVSFAVQNVAEIALFLTYAGNLLQPPEHLGKAWYGATVLVVVFLLHLAIITATNRPSGQRTPSAEVLILYVPVVVLQGLLWGSSLLIAGFEPMGYSITKVPGPLFFLWELYVVGYFTAAVLLLAYGAGVQVASHKRLQCKLLLLGISPLILLAISIVGLQRFGFRGFNATGTVPITSTILVLVAAYALYQYRLVDVTFYLPWSGARKRKTELYERIQKATARISELNSPRDILEQIANALSCRVTLFGGPQPWMVEPRGQTPNDGVRSFAEFPGEKLKCVERTITADEIAYSDPELHEIMKRYNVGAIVPFKSYSAPGYCLLLDRQFNEEFCSSLDFKVVDRLFAALAQRFFEDFLLVRSQLHDARNRLEDATRNLTRARESLSGVSLMLDAARNYNRNLREEVAQLRRSTLRLVSANALGMPGGKSLQEYLATREKEAIVAALRRCSGNRNEAARLLGISTNKLDSLIERHRLQSEASPVA